MADHEATIKADTLSIIACKAGLFVWMGLVYFVFFPGPHLKPSRPTYRFMMQVAMVIGFVAAYSMNRRLIRKGL